MYTNKLLMGKLNSLDNDEKVVLDALFVHFFEKLNREDSTMDNDYMSFYSQVSRVIFVPREKQKFINHIAVDKVDFFSSLSFESLFLGLVILSNLLALKIRNFPDFYYEKPAISGTISIMCDYIGIDYLMVLDYILLNDVSSFFEYYSC